MILLLTRGTTGGAAGRFFAEITTSCCWWKRTWPPAPPQRGSFDPDDRPVLWEPPGVGAMPASRAPGACPANGHVELESFASVAAAASALETHARCHNCRPQLVRGSDSPTMQKCFC